MVNKIVIIHENFFREHRDMGIELLREKGLEVELWSLYYVKYRKQEKLPIPIDCRKDKIIYLQSYFEIVCRILREKHSNTVYFFTTTMHINGIEDFTRTIIGITKQRYCNFIYEVCPTGQIQTGDIEQKNIRKKICEKV